MSNGDISNDMEVDEEGNRLEKLRGKAGSIHRDMEPASNDAMHDMEKLMEELIGFQERFGPGVKVRERDRRPLVPA